MNIQIIEFGNTDKKLLKEFVKCPWTIYSEDEKWVPPLDMEMLGNKMFGAIGLLTDKHPYHEHSEVVYFLAKKDGKTVGRIAGTVNDNHNKEHNEKTGFFGFFEVIDDFEVSKILLDKVKDWLKKRGMETMRGPANFSSNETWGLLVENFDDYPMIYTTYNKKYYLDHLLKYGFKKSMDLIAQIMTVMDEDETQKKRRARLERISEKVKKKHGVVVRPIDLSKKGFVKELDHIRYIYNHAWETNWGFIPITDHELEDIAVGMQELLKPYPGMASLAFVGDKPAAFIVNLPDINEFIRRKKSIFGNSDVIRLLRYLKNKKKHKHVRLLLFGIVKEHRKMGLDSILFVDSFRNAQDFGFEKCEVSWLLETNDLVIRHGEAMDAKEYRRWRLFDYKL